MSLVSVCCTTYNHEKFVKEAVESIWNQDYKDIEIIVLDDGSTDKTHQILKDLSLISPFPMKLMTQNNSGNIGANMNKMIKASLGKYITFISLDDKFLPNKISLLVKEIEKDEKIKLVIPSYCILIDDSGNQNGFSYSNVKGNNYDSLTNYDMLLMERDLTGGFYIQGCLFEKELIINCGMYDEDMLGDDIVIRTKIFKYLLNNPTYKFKIIDEVIFCYRIHQNNIHKNRERQCSILYEVANRYFDGKTPEILDDWIEGAIIYETIHGSTKNAIRLMLWDKKNRSKFKIFIKVFPIFLDHQINIFFRQRKILKIFRKPSLFIIIKKLILENLYKNYKKPSLFIIIKKLILEYLYKNYKKPSFKTINLNPIGDEKGKLVALEENINVPFKVKRVYYIFDTKSDVKRGSHAHKNLKQVIVCVNGSCNILLDNGKNKTIIELSARDNRALLIKNCIWREMYEFSSDCVLIVLANKYYDESDYIRNYQEFLNYVKNQEK